MDKNDPIAFLCGDGSYSSPLQRPKIDRRRGWIKTTHWLALAGIGTILPHRKAQNRQAARVDKNDPLACPCGDGDYPSPPQKPKKRQATRVAKNDPLACPCGDGDYSSPPQRPKIDRRQGWIKTIQSLFFAGDGLSVLSLPQKVQGLRKNISRKKRTPSDKNKPKTAAPGGAGFSGGEPAGRRPGGAAAETGFARLPAFGGRPAARIPVAAGTFPPSRANLCKTITISFYRKGGLAP